MAQTRLERSGSPTGWKRALFRAPVYIYRARLGFLFGKRFLMLEHLGRKSGATRYTVLETVVDDPGAVYVAAAWGDEAQWLRNIRAHPSIVFHLGSMRYPSVAEMVAEEEAVKLMQRYSRAHPAALRRLARYMLEDPGETSDEQARRIAERVPLVRLPKGPGHQLSARQEGQT